jgi:hypothetical protein
VVQTDPDGNIGFMEKEMAIRLVTAALALDEPIGELDGGISEPDGGEEKNECRRALGDVIGLITRHLVFRVYRQYSELDPDR